MIHPAAFSCVRTYQGVGSPALGAMPFSHVDLQVWSNYSPEQWVLWVNNLPAEGNRWYTKDEWQQWINMMLELTNVIEQLPLQQQQKRAKEEQPQQPQEPRLVLNPAQWKPAQGSLSRDCSADSSSEYSETSSAEKPTPEADFGRPASSESPPQKPAAPPARKEKCRGPPAQGPPAQANASSSPRPNLVVALPGSSAKDRKLARDAMRKYCRDNGLDRRGLSYRSTLAKAPPVCNRVASPWGKPPIACHCDEWPKWLQEHKDSTNLAETVTKCTDSDGLPMDDVVPGKKVCYWRPGKKGQKWWYNGKVASLQLVQFPTGKFAPVMGIN